MTMRACNRGQWPGGKRRVGRLCAIAWGSDRRCLFARNNGAMVAMPGFVYFVVLVPLILTATACQRPLKPIFDEADPPITWPADPTRARIRYVGCLTSSADLKAPRKPFQAITDFLVGAKAPQKLYGPRSVDATAKRPTCCEPK